MRKFFISVIVVTYNRKEEVVDCLKSIFKSGYQNFGFEKLSNDN